MQIFIAGPLYTKKNRKIDLYENISKLCNMLGYRTFVPHIDTESIYSPADPKIVFIQDFNGLNESNLLIAEVTSPSHGVGSELMQAYLSNIPIICIKEKGAKISRMVRGNPKIQQIIEYYSHEDCLLQIDNALKLMSGDHISDRYKCTDNDLYVK